MRLSLPLSLAAVVLLGAAARTQDVQVDPAALQLQAYADVVNARLAAEGAGYILDHAEYLTSGDQAGQIVFFNNRGNKQLGAHFVAGDPRRGGGTNITYIIDQTEGAIDALTQAQTNAAIDRAMATWDGVNCSALPIVRVADQPGDIGVIEFLNGLGGSGTVFADVTHAGWLPAGILGNNVIGVTFTFIWVINPGSVPTDIDNDGRSDVAFREILYNDSFNWQVNGNFDVETVALHESGHGLSQGHFGKAFRTTANGKLHFSPRAVMNAAYSGIQQAIGATDNAGHCSIWGSWPH